MLSMMGVTMAIMLLSVREVLDNPVMKADAIGFMVLSLGAMLFSAVVMAFNDRKVKKLKKELKKREEVNRQVKKMYEELQPKEALFFNLRHQ